MIPTRWLIVLALGTVVFPGCIRRTISIDSEPRGAIVWLNDEEVGRTPVTVPFTFYGTYDVRLEKEEFATVQGKRQAKGPWWEAPGPDLLVEALPWTTRVDLQWFYTLSPAEPADEVQLIERAAELRQRAQ
jgi:hypothetical protein